MTSCDGCAECCRLLPIAELAKPADQTCQHARPGATNGCCTIYAARPSSCVGFTCLWLASQGRADPDERSAPMLRPDRTHVVFYRNGTESDPRLIHAHVDPAHADAWQRRTAAAEISRLTERGATVVVLIGECRVLLRAGHRPFFTTEFSNRKQS